MTADTIREYLHATPFAPFTVHLMDGRFFHVDQPDFATLMRDNRHLLINTEGVRIAVVDLDKATALETSVKAA